MPSIRKEEKETDRSAPKKNARTDEKVGAERRPISTRKKVGWIAIGMLVLIIFGALRYRQTGEVGVFELNRMCVMMFLLWLAWPELEALPRWLLCAVPIMVVVCAWRPQYLIVVLPLSFLYLLLRPPRAKKNKKNPVVPGLTSLFKRKKNIKSPKSK